MLISISYQNLAYCILSTILASFTFGRLHSHQIYGTQPNLHIFCHLRVTQEIIFFYNRPRPSGNHITHVWHYLCFCNMLFMSCNVFALFRYLVLSPCTVSHVYVTFYILVILHYTLVFIAYILAYYCFVRYLFIVLYVVVIGKNCRVRV